MGAHQISAKSKSSLASSCIMSWGQSSSWRDGGSSGGWDDGGNWDDGSGWGGWKRGKDPQDDQAEAEAEEKRKAKQRKENERKHGQKPQKDREEIRKPLLRDIQKERARADAAEAPALPFHVAINECPSM